jgi:hypothetical protein
MYSDIIYIDSHLPKLCSSDIFSIFSYCFANPLIWKSTEKVSNYLLSVFTIYCYGALFCSLSVSLAPYYIVLVSLLDC